MDIIPLASGSHGNAYHIQDGAVSLLLECGINYRRIQEGLKFRTSSLAGVLISHSHMDHAQAARSLLRAGIDCYASEPTITALGLSGHRIHTVREREQFTVAGWTVLPFPTEHDCEGSLGFLIAALGGEKLLYVTDSFYVRHRFSGLNYVMVECNYAGDILQENVRSGEVHPALRRRIARSHMSLSVVKDMLLANDLSQVQEIWLLHLSDGNSDAERFKREIQETTGKVVRVA